MLFKDPWKPHHVSPMRKVHMLNNVRGGHCGTGLDPCQFVSRQTGQSPEF